MNGGNAADRTAPAVRARGLHFRYPDGTAGLGSIDLEIGTGERWGIIGANGSGKSTLLHHCAGVHPADGHLWVLGVEATRSHLPEIRRRVGFLFQDPDDQLFLPTVAEDVAFGPRNAGLDDAEVACRVEESLARLDIAHLADRPTHRLSGGEKQGAAIAAVLALHPEVLVLDEPTNDLDPGARRRLVGFLRAWPSTLVIATHDLEFLLGTVDRIAVLEGGGTVATGDADAILHDRELLERHGLEEPPSVRALRAAGIDPRSAPGMGPGEDSTGPPPRD